MEKINTDSKMDELEELLLNFPRRANRDGGFLGAGHEVYNARILVVKLDL